MVAVRCSAAIRRAVRGAELQPDARLARSSGSVSDDGGGSGTASQVTQPGSTHSPARARPAPCAARRPGVDTLTWLTAALPPPWVTGCQRVRADDGQRAQRCRRRGGAPRPVVGQQGERRRRGPPQQRRVREGPGLLARPGSRRVPRAHAIEAPSRELPGPARRPGGPGAGPAAPCRPRRPPAIRPARTAAASRSPHGPAGPGMARSSPAAAVSSVLRAACQSDTTTPPNPHSSLSTPVSSAVVLGHGGPVDGVVAGHDGQHARLPDHRLERDQVQLTQHVRRPPGRRRSSAASRSRCR